MALLIFKQIENWQDKVLETLLSYEVILLWTKHSSSSLNLLVLSVVSMVSWKELLGYNMISAKSVVLLFKCFCNDLILLLVCFLCHCDDLVIVTL